MPHRSPGEFWVHAIHPFDATPPALEVTRADPVIWVSRPMLELARSGDPPAMKTTVHGSVELLTITASNGAWIYVVGHYDSGRDVYLCHWPD